MCENQTENILSSKIQEEFTIDDCEELLNFPFHEYTTNNVQKEINECILDSGISGNLAEATKDISEEDSEIEITEYPEDTHLIESCLSVNVRFQAKLTEAINKLQDALKKNTAKRDALQKLIDDEGRKVKVNKKERIFSVFSAPYFQDVRKRAAPPNEDAKIRLKNIEVITKQKPFKQWTKKEKENLRKGVYASALKYILNPYYIRLQYLESKLNGEHIQEYEKNVLEEEIANVKIDIQNESDRPHEEVISEAKDHIDWLEVSAHLDGSRNFKECETMWNNYASIVVNKKPFSPEEDAKLQQLAQEHNERNWDSIAEKLKTGRSAFQCFQRYQSHLNKSLIRKFWTPEEDAKMLKVIETYRVGKFIPWNIVCNYLENRNVERAMLRYETVLSREINRGPWTKEEDAMIMACVKRFGNNWRKAKQLLVGRINSKIRARYEYFLDPSFKCGGWSEAEDNKLIELMKKHGFGKWKKIAAEMPKRNSTQCKIRAKKSIMGKFCKNGKIVGDLDKILPTLKPHNITREDKQREELKLGIQEAASQTLKSALEKIAASLNETIDLETLDLSSLSSIAFKKLHKELIKKQDHYINTAPVWEPEYLDENGKRLSNIKRRKEIDRDGEGDWLERVLEAKVQEKYNLPEASPYTVSLSLEDSAECSIYEKYLQQLLMCGEALNNDERDFTFEGVDYKTSVIDTARRFIQPSLKENHMLVLPPNSTTLVGLDIIKVEDSALRRTADFADHSIPYLRYLIGLKKDVPKCIRCCNAESTEITFKDIVNKMKSRLVVIDEDMETAIKVETGQVAVQKQKCCCEELACSKNVVDLLTKRFLSLFFWPFLISSVDLNQEQEKYLTMRKNALLENGIQSKYYPSRIVRRKRKRSANDCIKGGRKNSKLLQPEDRKTYIKLKSCVPPLQVNLRSKCRNKDILEIEDSS
ncbi:transcription factor MYB3R-4 [Trichonephila inaurata madagascariensis]|uniref:Transcription factor MYB3R-4 n=1 Tax=Trichonephila inaurata madagascariensis TaxID=2747483 RepID=A0A8X7CEF4_9ARAC|nr:transcription factor MYB3R-4 [Trichonephila inaurata madagascariensis]